MDALAILVGKVAPLYAIIIMGFAAARLLRLNQTMIANLVVFFITPVIIFGYTAQLPFSYSIFAYPLLGAFISTTMGLLSFWLARPLCRDARANLLGSALLNSNTGYFGIPLFLALFGTDNLGLFLATNLGLMVANWSFGYYLLARGHFSARASLYKIIRLPALYVFLAGVMYSAFMPPMPVSVLQTIDSYRGAYVVLGMMLVGLGIGSLKTPHIDKTMLGFALAMRFVAWPLFCVALISLDALWLGWFDQTTIGIIMVFALAPIGANIVIAAAQLGIETDQAAWLVALSTLVALITIPLYKLFLWPVVGLG